MKRPLIILSAVLLIAATATAQVQRHIAAEQSKIATFLQLTPDQKATWDSLHADLQNTISPLLDQARSAREQLSAFLRSDSPDPAAVGTQVIALHSIEKQIVAAHNAAAQKIEALLTPDQKTKFEALRATSNEPMAMSVAGCAPGCEPGSTGCPIH